MADQKFFSDQNGGISQKLPNHCFNMPTMNLNAFNDIPSSSTASAAAGAYNKCENPLSEGQKKVQYDDETQSKASLSSGFHIDGNVDASAPSDGANIGDAATSSATITSTSSTSPPNHHTAPKAGSVYFNSARQRYAPYYNRSLSNSKINNQQWLVPNAASSGSNQSTQSTTTMNSSGDSGFASMICDSSDVNSSFIMNGSAEDGNFTGFSGQISRNNDTTVTLQIGNIDTALDDHALKQYLISKLKPITPVLSFVYESVTSAKLQVPSLNHAKNVIAYLHRKKIGHKRVVVSYTRDSSTMEPSTLRCQVAGLLKDMPLYKVAMYKFRELFHSRFKTSISLLDLYEMKDICTITDNGNDEKIVHLRSELINSIENSELLGCLQLSVPYCTVHFKNGHRGWAEQEIEPLPLVFMPISTVRTIVYTLLKNHKGDIPLASLVYCIEAELNMTIERKDNGINLEHLISCVNGVHITSNKFGIKILRWLEAETVIQNNAIAMTTENTMTNSRFTKFGNNVDLYGQITREIIDLIKTSPKSTMKFSRFIPAYHNHYGKQCRVADYGYTKLIELFEALPQIVQIIGDGENRQITLTHKCQIRCFTTDLLRCLRSQINKSLALARLPELLSVQKERKFDITDYGVCDIEDIMESLFRTNVIAAYTDNGQVMISIPKRQQTRGEIERICGFAAEAVELLRRASQFTIPFEKFACSYHYHYGYQCRLSDYGCLKLIDLMEAITGAVEIEMADDGERKVSLSPKIAQRIFSEQLCELVKLFTGFSGTPTNLSMLLYWHKKHYGYQMQLYTLKLGNVWYNCIKSLPFIELKNSPSNEDYVVTCHHENKKFILYGYAACRIVVECGKKSMFLDDFINGFFSRYSQILDKTAIDTLSHAIEVFTDAGVPYVRLSPIMAYILRIARVLECMHVISFAELKTILMSGINDCFAFGYPTLESLLQAFPDVFFTSTPLITETCKISLNKTNHLVQSGVHEYFLAAEENRLAALPLKGINPTAPTINQQQLDERAQIIKFQQQIKPPQHLEPSLPPQPLTQPPLPQSLALQPLNQPFAQPLKHKLAQPINQSLSQSFTQPQSFPLPYHQQLIPQIKPQMPSQFTAQMHPQSVMLPPTLMQPPQMPPIKNLQHYPIQHQTNHSNILPLNGKNNVQSQRWSNNANPQSFGLNDPQTNFYLTELFRQLSLGEECTKEEFEAHIKLYERKPSQKFIDSANAVRADKAALIAKFGPPKPDSPPANIPYWLDPVWSNDLNLQAPITKDSINIPLPDLKVVDAIFDLNTPKIMNELYENHKSIFTFDFNN